MLKRRGFLTLLTAIFVRLRPRPAGQLLYRGADVYQKQIYFLDPDNAGWTIRATEGGPYAFGFTGFTAVDGPSVGLTIEEAQRLIDSSKEEPCASRS